MRYLAAALLVLAACGGGDDERAGQATVTTEDFGPYCRLMERTDEAYREADERVDPTTLSALAEAEARRIREAPDELRDEYSHWGRGAPIPNEAVERIQDWTQEHCGFLPTF